VCLIAPSASAWLSGYSYRQEHNITGDAVWSGDQTNYQIKFIVDTGAGSSSGNTIYLNSHSQADIDDIQFTDLSDTPYHYWVLSTSNPYTVWVEVDTIPDGGIKQIYVYYGDADAVTSSNGDNTFIFFDHFAGSSLNTTSKWTQISGSASVSSSWVTGGSSNDMISKTTGGTNTRIMGYGSLVNTATTVFGGDTAYTLDFARYTTASNKYYYQNGNAPSYDNPGADLGNTYTGNRTWEVLRNGTTNTMGYIDGSLVATSATNVDAGSEPVRMYSGSSSSLKMDWTFISKYVYPEPVHSTWYSEESEPVAPVAAFSGNVTSGYPAFNVSFTDASTGSPDTWYWEFGDGDTSTDQNPVHTYDSTIGNIHAHYSVNLNASNSTTGFDWENKTDYITAWPLECGFTVNTTNGPAPLWVEFTDGTINGTATAWNWSFGDGQYSNDQNPIHEYTSGGVYDVELNASNAYSYSIDTVVGQITVEYSDSFPVAFVSERDGDYDRVIAFDARNMTYFDQVNGYSSRGSATDGTYLYVTDMSTDKLYKLYANNLTYIMEVGGSHPGSGDDEFDDPVGVTTDGTYLFVVDRNNARVVKRFCSNLTYISQVGSYGSGDDQFETPNYITNDGTYIYITDFSTNRVIKRLMSDLTFDSSNGDTWGPYGITYYNGNLYVISDSNSTILKYASSDLSFVEEAGEYGTDPDQFSYPHGIDNNGEHLFIVDSDTNRLIRWDLASLVYDTYVNISSSWATSSDGPWGVSVCNSCGGDNPPLANFTANVTSGSAPLWVGFTDTSLHNPTSWYWEFGDGNTSTDQNPIHEYTTSGIYSVNLSASNNFGSDWENKTSYIIVGAGSSIWWDKDTYSQFETATVSWFISNVSWVLGDTYYAVLTTVADPNTTIWYENITTQSGSFNVDLSLGWYNFTDYRIWLVSEGVDGLYITSSVGFDHVDKFDVFGNQILSWLDSIPFVPPICSDPSGDIYIVNGVSDYVAKYNSGGDFILSWNTTNPNGVCSDPSGDIYISYYEENKTNKFDSLGNSILTWNATGPGPLCSDPSGDIYVKTNTFNISKYDSLGNFILSWSLGSEEPVAICSDPSGDIYVATTGVNNIIHKFNSLGNYILEWESPNTIGICSDLNGYIYVPEYIAITSHIYIYDSSGNLVGLWDCDEFPGRITYGTHGHTLAYDDMTIVDTDAIWWDKETYLMGETANVTWHISSSSLANFTNFIALISTVADLNTTIQSELLPTQDGFFYVSLLPDYYNADDYRVQLAGW
jgi:PKD repeat protein